MTCTEFERWLDDGRPADPAALAHADGCARCAEALRVASEVEGALERTLLATRAPAAFTERVMARVGAASAARSHVPVPALASAEPWWLRAAASPESVLALLLAALLMWRGGALWGPVAALMLSWGRAASGVSLPVPPAVAPYLHPPVLLGLVVAALPLMGWGVWRLYRWAEHAAGVPIRRRHLR